MQQKIRSLTGPGKEIYPRIFKLTRGIKRYLKKCPGCAIGYRRMRVSWCVGCKRFVLDKPGKTHNCRVIR